MDEPDPVVVQAAATGDRDAFAELVRHCQTDVWRFLCHLVGDPERAAELAQDTFVRAYRGLPGYRFESRFSSWLLRIARNLAIDDMRAQRRRDQRDRHLRVRALRADEGRAPSIAEQRHELQAALDSLSPRLREPFVLVEVLGMTYREVASILNVPEGTVKSRVFHARRDLVAWFDAGQDDTSKPGEVGRG